MRTISILRNFHCKDIFLTRRMSSSVYIKRDEVSKFCTNCMLKVGCKQEHAFALAEVLAEADHRGHFSHGLNRIEMYVRDIESGICSKDNEPSLIKETVSTAFIDGNNCLGPVVGNFAMKKAIEKSKNTGVGWVVAKGSNHYGIAGWYSMMASKEGLLGMSFTNTSPLAYPTRSQQLSLGTNPLTLAAPASKPEDEYVLDMATTGVAIGKVEMCRRKGQPIPKGWAADKEGKVTTDPTEALAGGLFPLGGEELTGGYKGYGLQMLVEIFCGMLSGSDYGSHVRRWMNTTKEANLGQCFIAIDPSVFAPGFPERMSTFANELRNLTPVDPQLPVLIPGDPERSHIKKVSECGGIPYPPVLIDSMNQLADRLSVSRMPIVKTE